MGMLDLRKRKVALPQNLHLVRKPWFAHHHSWRENCHRHICYTQLVLRLKLCTALMKRLIATTVCEISFPLACDVASKTLPQLFGSWVAASDCQAVAVWNGLLRRLVLIGKYAFSMLQGKPMSLIFLGQLATMGEGLNGGVRNWRLTMLR